MEIDQKTRDSLFAVIRAGMGLPVPALKLSEEECASLLWIARRQSIMSIVYRGLKQMGVSQSVLKDYDQFRLRTEYQSVQHDDALKRICAVLDEEKIPYVLLKGAVIRHLYPDPVLRSSCDIDVLVHEEDIDKAVTVLEAKTDFKKEKKLYHDISMVSSRVHLELHFNIKEDMDNIDPLLSKVWDYTCSAGEETQYSMTPEFQIFHVVAHMDYHFLHGGLGIRPFLDLWLLRNKTQYDETGLEQLFAECKLLQFYRECSHLSEVWMDGAEPTETSQMFEDFCLSGGVLGNEQFSFAGKQKDKRGLRYIGSRVFPPKNQIKEFYRAEDGKDHVLAYYYVKRWRRWLSKERRSEFKRQVNGVMNCDKKYQDAADELFRRLGV